MVDLESIYLRTLRDCAPREVVRHFVEPAMPRTVVAIGKCAGRLMDGVAASMNIERALCAIPHGYPNPVGAAALGMTIVRGGHPDIDDDSFRAGDQLLEFVDSCDDVLFLISGGGSACVEVPQAPFTREEVAMVNARLVRSGLPIGAINTVRKHLSAIKGGRLAARVHGRAITLVYSDVPAGAISDVASGPTVADSTTSADAARILERVGGCNQIVTKLRDETLPGPVTQAGNASWKVIADNVTLTATAARLLRAAGHDPVLLPQQIESGVEEAARLLAARASSLRERQVLVAGGEATVVRQGDGRGGRCCEMAVRFALARTRGKRFTALFGSSDGVDGSSGVAAIVTDASAPLDRDRLLALLDGSDSLPAAKLIGRAVIIPPTGNNLRDLFLVAPDTA